MRKGAYRNRFLQEECTVLITKLKLPLSYAQTPSRIHAFLPEAAFCMHGNILAIYRGKSHRGKKRLRMQKQKRLKTHNTPIPSPTPHANLSSIIQHMRDNRQTARGHLQRAGCQGRPVERVQACPHQSPAAAREPQRCSFPWGCNEIQRWRTVLELL